MSEAFARREQSRLPLKMAGFGTFRWGSSSLGYNKHSTW
jgi:hypothetical protein